jgi:hypothetical protein
MNSGRMIVSTVTDVFLKRIFWKELIFLNVRSFPIATTQYRIESPKGRESGLRSRRSSLKVVSGQLITARGVSVIAELRNR